VVQEISQKPVQEIPQKSEQQLNAATMPASPLRDPEQPLRAYRRLPAEAKMMIPQWYKIALESAQLVDSTKTIDVFFERYSLMLENMENIAGLAPSICYWGATITERIADLRQKQMPLLAKLIVRGYNEVCEKAKKLKTERGRTNAVDRYFVGVQAIAAESTYIKNLLDELQAHVQSMGISPFSHAESCNLSAVNICNFAIVYYKNGRVVDLVPKASSDLYDYSNSVIYYAANYFVSDGVEVNLLDYKTISQLPIPRFDEDSLTSNLAYQLKMRAIRVKDPIIAKALIPKTAEIMRVSNILWSADDYRRLVRQLLDLGLKEEAASLSHDYKCGSAEERQNKLTEKHDQFEAVLDYCRELKTDLVEMDALGETCGECAKYEGRVFSVSGKDKRFPKLPEVVFKYGGIHEGCRHRFSPYFYGSSLINTKEDAESYSNRPFVDGRSDQQKENYEAFLESQIKRQQKIEKMEQQLT
jgi:hypothetical protein